MPTESPFQHDYSPLTSPVPIVVPRTPARDVEEEPKATGRVLHVVNGQHYSGAERVQDLLALRLPEFGFDVAFACLKPDQFPTMRRSQTTPLHQIPMRSRVDFGVLRALIRIAREGDFDALHAHTPRSLLLASVAARKLRLPLIYHVHSPTSRDSTRRIRSWINGLVEALGLAQVARILTVSQSLATHIKHMGLPAERITVVPNGVPTTDLQRDDQPPTATWTLGTVALFRPRKGTEVLIDAMAQLRQQGYNVRLRAVGPFETSEYQRELLDRVARHDLHDAVDWVGFTEDVNAELRRMDLFVLPSLFGEGLPMVVLEAMAAGVPPVGTAVEGVPEAILDGVSGVLAQPGDANDLARAISRLIDGQVDWCHLRENAIARHADFFSDTAMARGVAEAYQELLL